MDLIDFSQGKNRGFRYNNPMEFTGNSYLTEDTIAAIATPPGEGGVAIIRISGSEAIKIAGRVFSGDVASYLSHTAHYGRVIDQKGVAVDDALLIPMLGKRSYTGEDTVEIQCHGGVLISRSVLEVVLKAGARAALPGEFTFRAYINGRLDLAQAEAVQELIHAKNELAVKAAERQLEGRLSAKVLDFQRDLTGSAAILEAWVDFPDEGLEFASIDEICDAILAVKQRIDNLVQTFHDGKMIHDGIALCLIGSPNVGKSSLMNALLDRERAIVSPIPGTTRDVVEDEFRLNGLNLRLIDTAGIRETDELIELEGIRRSKMEMSKADLILLVLDASRPLTQNDHELMKLPLKNKTILVWNKCDLPHNELKDFDFPHSVRISAMTKEGLESLHKKIDSVIWENGPPSLEEVLVTSLRHKEALARASESCDRVINGLKTGVSPEFVASDMRQVLMELGKIIGTNVSEDILDAIFSKFCIGK